MNQISYNVIQYCHDRAIGEALNVGVLAFDFSSGQAALEYERSYRRLSEMYLSFDSEGYRLAFEKLKSGLSKRSSMNEERRLVQFADYRVGSSEELAKRVWPDLGLSFALSPVRFSMASNVFEEAKRLFERYVLSIRKANEGQRRRDDSELWEDILKRSERFEGVAARLHPQVIGPNEIKFDRVAKERIGNRLIAVEPLSLDYLEPSRIADRAFILGGKAHDLSDFPAFEKLMVLIGDPKRISNRRHGRDKATKILSRYENISVFEEERAESALQVLNEWVS